MKNRLTTLKNLAKPNLCLLAIIIAIFSTLAIGVETFAIQNPAQAAQSAAPTGQSAVPTKQITPSVADTIPEKNAYAMNHMEKTGFKYGFFRFLLAMLGVLVSSGAIFLGLKLYKNVILKNNTKLDNLDYNKTLDSPKDFKEAINLFLDKTDKE